MIKSLIIGAGQLGCRHLQGMLKSKNQSQTIYIIDPSEDALNISKARAEEVEHNHQVYFQQDYNNLPDSFDVIIVATSANVRENVVTQLLNHFQVKYLILEKVLFTDLDSYKRVGELLKNCSTKVFVNHARRMFQSYKELKKIVDIPFIGTFQVVGGNWGLGCNGLHFIDLLEFLSDSQVDTLDANWVDNDLLESKRRGFVEFTGTIKGRLKNGATFQVTSLAGEPSVPTITMFSTENRFLIQEGGTPAIYKLSKNDSFAQHIIPLNMEFQSNLTTRLIDELQNKGNCTLPTFEEASHTHLLFIKALLKKYNKTAEADNHILPIT